MSLNLPSSQSAELWLTLQQSVELGNISTPLTTETSFSLVGWFRIPDVSGRAVLRQGDHFRLEFGEGKVNAYLGSTSISCPQTLKNGDWYHVAVVFDASKVGSQQISLYIDGIPTTTERYAIVTAPAQSLLLEAKGTALAVRRLSLWSIPLTNDQVATVRYARPDPQSGLQGAWDFAVVPAHDESGNEHPIYYNGAAQKIWTPGLDLQGGGYASAQIGSADWYQKGFTLQAWVKFRELPASKQWLVAVGEGANPAFGIVVEPDTRGTAGQANLGFSIGSGSFGFDSKFDLVGWTHVTVSYDPASATPAKIYLNGKFFSHSANVRLEESHGTSLITVGAAGNGSGGFNGTIQNVTVWSRALSDDEIAESLLPLGPDEDNLPLALLDFSVAPATNLIAGETVALHGAASVKDIALAVPAGLDSRAAKVERERATVVAKRQEKRQRGLAEFKMRALSAIDPALFSPEAVERVLGSGDGGLVAALTDEQRAKVRSALADVYAKARQGNLSLAGTFMTQRFGDDWVTFFQGADGVARPLAKQSASRPLGGIVIDPCTAWVIDMGATAIFGVLSCLNVPTTPSAVLNAIKRICGSSKVLRAFGNVLASKITSESCVALVKSLNDENYLNTFVKDIFSNLRWWDFAWMVAALVIELVGLFFPGATLTILLTKLALTVAQLAYVGAQRPKDCPNSLF